uniref:Deoxyribonuclease II n=1 Tax=Trichuris muris TaxID=70415 RepID=A0A5S6QEB0_TRIMR
MPNLYKGPRTSVQTSQYSSMEKHIIWISALSLYAGIANAAALKCKNGNADIDWAIFYVIPGQQNAHAIYGSQTPAWEAAPVDLTAADGVLDGLFKPYYTAATKVNYNLIAYSDYPPFHREPSKCASPVRGVLGYTDSDGWWLSHSIDKWPDMQAAAFAAPPAGGAGLIVCVTLPVSEMGRWGTALNYQNPMIYYFQSAAAGTANALVDKKELNDLTIPPAPIFSPFVRKEEFQIPNGLKYSVFSMLPQAKQDIYSAYIALALQTKLIVYTTYTVENVKAQTITVNGAQITRSEDSSRWAISKANNAKAVFCICGNDRRKNAIGSGGGALCLHQQTVHQLFRAMVSNKDIEACKTT